MTREKMIGEVWRALEAVSDPELDDSLPRLGFVRAVEVDEQACVRVALRLPTYWCAANFAFMMAEDARAAIERLKWVREASVIVEDHYSGEEINRGIAARLEFGAAFPGEAGGDLAALRRIFRAKAFMRRQEKLLRRMLADGYDAGQLAALTLDDFARIDLRDDDGARLRADYLAIRGEFARNSRLMFTTAGGKPLDPETFAGYLAELRRTTANIEFNAAMCGSLLKARAGSMPEPEKA